MQQRQIRKTIRFNEEELKDAEAKMKHQGYGELSAFVRHLINQCPKRT